VFVGLLVASFGPLVLFGRGPAIILPVLMIWLAVLAQALGVPVSGRGIDAFNLMPPNIIGSILIAIGFVISLALYYWLAGVLARRLVKSR
jgi:hypothetical protein